MTAYAATHYQQAVSASQMPPVPPLALRASLGLGVDMRDTIAYPTKRPYRQK
jgi:hypothetical protein